uniref:Reverse transcriptase domain-containing protein n=1 Tax=Oncorhynchus kisutch TaxID=8019 RepID=A0A8C7I3E1_ONCKI
MGILLKKQHTLFEKKARDFIFKNRVTLSALLYVLYIEPFVCAIRTNYNIKGIILPGGDMLKISHYADDTVLYLQDDLSLKESVKVIDEFSVASGSKINKNKTEIKPLGQWKWTTDQLCGLTVYDMFNWKEKLLSLNKRLGLWKVRRLSFSGKVLVLKADILPSLLHLAYVFPLPVSLRKTFIQVLFNFCWGGYEYIRRDRMYQPIEAGGRDFPHSSQARCVVLLKHLSFVVFCTQVTF